MTPRRFLPCCLTLLCVLLLSACSDQRMQDAFTENEGVRLMVGRDILADVGEAVMAAVAAGAPQAQRAKGEVDIVADDQQVVHREVQFLQPVTDGIAAEVHVGGGLEEVELPALVMDDGHVAVSSGFEGSGSGTRSRTLEDSLSEVYPPGIQPVPWEEAIMP